MTQVVTAGATGVDEARVAAIVRDIARGGLAAAIVGFVVGGVGGRLVMRLAALLVPAAAGSATENGNRIGAITADGTMFVILFGGLLGGVGLGVVWVVLSPWLPRRPLVRAAVAMPIAVALAGFVLVQGANSDFVVLRHDPAVVASLLLLVAATGPAMVLVDGWLEARLPRPARFAGAAVGFYLLVAGLGALVGGPMLIRGAFERPTQPLALTVIGVGVITLAWWVQRVRGRSVASTSLRLAASAVLVAGTIWSAVALTPEVVRALGAD